LNTFYHHIECFRSLTTIDFLYSILFILFPNHFSSRSPPLACPNPLVTSQGVDLGSRLGDGHYYRPAHPAPPPLPGSIQLIGAQKAQLKRACLFSSASFLEHYIRQSVLLAHPPGIQSCPAALPEVTNSRTRTTTPLPRAEVMMLATSDARAVRLLVGAPREREHRRSNERDATKRCE
jgi:hypothetical protein